jgi:peptide-methionine (S)-S-oxide reductase
MGVGWMFSLRGQMKKSVLFVGLLIAGSLMAATFPEPPKPSAAAGTQKATAVLAGGCFWGLQGIYEHVKGVTRTDVGYAGGTVKNPTYEQVETARTGHAESVRIEYDPSQVSYGTLLKIFFEVAHDPTTLNRQHYDVGPQYRSAIFYMDDEQKQTAESYIKELNAAKVFKDPIVTQVAALQNSFYRAEDYHQHYLDQVVACDTNNRRECGQLNQGYIRGIDIPLQNAFKKTFPDLFMKESK